MVSGDLDEYKIRDLGDSPIDAFESGHRLVTGSGSASAGFVYKLVAIEDPCAEGRMRAVAKKSEGKKSQGGKKIAKRRIDFDGIALEESLFLASGSKEKDQSGNYRDLQFPLIQKGNGCEDWGVGDARKHLTKITLEIPEELRLQVNSDPAIPTVVHRESL